MVSVILLPLVLMAIYAAVRRAAQRWWIWAGGISFVFAAVRHDARAGLRRAAVQRPTSRCAPAPVREAVLSLARANRSRPTTSSSSMPRARPRASAPTCPGSSARRGSSLNDNLLNKTSLPEIKAVLGHEMGHYVLESRFARLPIYLTLVLAFGFWFIHRMFDCALARWGARLGLEDRADPAALPLAVRDPVAVLLPRHAADQFDHPPDRRPRPTRSA